MAWAASRYGWAPDVTRRQSWRDLYLLLESQQAMADASDEVM